MPEINQQNIQIPPHQKHLSVKIWLPVVLVAAFLVGYLAQARLNSWWPYQGRNDNSFTVTPVKHWQDKTTTWQTYRNEEYGFEITFTNAWKNYRVGGGQNYVFFTIEVPSKALGATWFYHLFIGVFTEEEWQEYEADVDALRPYTNIIAEKDGIIYAYGYGSQDYPPDVDATKPLFGVDEILSTFKFIE